MSATGPPAAQHNGPSQPQPSYGYINYPSTNNASPAFYSQVPSKVTPSYTSNQYGPNYHYANYAALPPHNTMAPPVQHNNHLNANQGTHQSFQELSLGHHVSASHGPGQGAVPPVAPVQSYPKFADNYSYAYPANSSCPPQGLPNHSSHYSTPLVSNPLYQGAPYTSMPASSQYGQVVAAHQLATQVTGGAQGLQTAAASTVLPSDFPRQSAPPPAPSVQPRKAQDGPFQNHSLSLAPINQPLSSVSSALHEAGQKPEIGHPGLAASAPTSLTAYTTITTTKQSAEPSSSMSSLHPAPPTVQQSMQYAGYVNNQANFAPTPLSSSSDDEEDEEDDEEAGIDESSSTTSSASSEPKNYDVLEGGGCTEMPPATNSTAPVDSISQSSRPSKPFGHGYPTLQPGYQNSASPHGSQSNTPVHRPGYSQYPSHYGGMNQLPASLAGLSLNQAPQPEGLRPINLIQDRNVLPSSNLQAPVPNLTTDLKKLNCNPEFFRCTLTSIPQTQALLNKAKLPLGLLLHPFKSKPRIPTISSSTIVRCRSCRTYINPFVSFIDQRRWKCNLCYRVNDVPEEFMYNPVTRSYGEPHKRSEVLSSSVEFVASSDYMVRHGHFVTVHFYSLQEGLSQPQMLVVSDVDDIFLPTPDGLLVNLHESMELIKDLLTALPSMFLSTRETHSALGPALQGAFKLMSPTGGRISVFQTQLPSLGAGLLQSREDPNQRSSTKGIQHLGPATDFYKKLALDCSGQQTAVDLFLLSSQYSDLSSLGLSIHTFHGNFFVRSTDLLSLANINEDAGFAVQMSIDESLTDTSLACFQVALLYTSSKGQRRIRVHTLCLPVVNSLPDVFAGADVQAITCLLANMAVDRSISSSISDARDALVNAVVDSLMSYNSTLSNLQQSALIAPNSLKLFPLYILALLKQAMYIWIGRNCDVTFLKDVLGFPNYASVPPKMNQLPELDTLASERTRNFISWLKQDSPLNPVLYVLKDDSVGKTEFFQHLIEDRSEAAFSYYEFLLHIQQQICK
uniref:Protein transport protein Sec24B n=1 Tax=Pyxicephalus adspersus TaxID=30357 RepID=A0AAV3AC63_PYXAD|nr:TPA: hypothetical protein GDO54_009165 [Pyxicephalus adspersus]